MLLEEELPREAPIKTGRN